MNVARRLEYTVSGTIFVTQPSSFSCIHSFGQEVTHSPLDVVGTHYFDPINMPYATVRFRYRPIGKTSVPHEATGCAD